MMILNKANFESRVNEFTLGYTKSQVRDFILEELGIAGMRYIQELKTQKLVDDLMEVEPWCPEDKKEWLIKGNWRFRIIIYCCYLRIDRYN